MSQDKLEPWTEAAIEPFFQLLPKEVYENDMINSSKVRCAQSKIAPPGKGVFARVDIKKGEIVEWSVATPIPGFNVLSTDAFFAWSREDRTKAATISGCALFYNTLGDKSNVRMVPYHKECRAELYALRDISAGEELTIRYDSMNYRPAMSDLLPIVGQLESGDKQDVL